jgi:hypothetical protein
VPGSLHRHGLPLARRDRHVPGRPGRRPPRRTSLTPRPR